MLSTYNYSVEYFDNDTEDTMMAEGETISDSFAGAVSQIETIYGKDHTVLAIAVEFYEDVILN